MGPLRQMVRGVMGGGGGVREGRIIMFVDASARGKLEVILCAACTVMVPTYRRRTGTCTLHVVVAGITSCCTTTKLPWPVPDDGYLVLL